MTDDKNKTLYGPIKSLSDLFELEKNIKNQFKDSLILFRGQDSHFDTVLSGRLRPNLKFNPEVEKGWHSFASQMIESIGEDVDLSHEVKAILQHYGMATHYIDLTSDIEVASWFATNTYSKKKNFYIGSALRRYEKEIYTQKKTGTGYILVFVIKNHHELLKIHRLFDLSRIPGAFVRPHAQKGWLMYQRPPLLPDPNKHWVATIKVDCNSFETKIPHSNLFPSPKIDTAYSAMLQVPYIQIPSIYYADLEEDGDINSFRNRMCFAAKVINIGEHEFTDGTTINHKYHDNTIWEQHPMLCWKFWKYPLEDHIPNISGDIKDCVKVTIAPWVTEELNNIIKNPTTVFRWPEFGEKDILFSFANISHDKMDDGPPETNGVWLHKEDDLIIEHPVVADKNYLTVHAGHSYLFSKNKVLRQKTEYSCKCDEPNSHDARVSTVLSLSYLIECNKAVLVPHPEIPDWYVVF